MQLGSIVAEGGPPAQSISEDLSPMSNAKKFSRRTLLAAMPVAASRAAESKLAIDGGAPVRATSLSTGYPGAQFYDEQERTELNQAYDTHSLFRFYGFSQPQKVRNFEKEFAAFMGVKYVLGVTSGTAALHTALAALGVGPGDEVILPAWTWHSCYTAILATGALPVFAEVDESFTLDPADVEKRITPNTRAIMPVHLFGAPADMARLTALARKHGIRILEDTAQATGASFQGKRLGTHGDIGIYSFQMHKLITAGEGGAIVTNDPLLYERAIRFHDLGNVRPVHQEALGNLQMPYYPGLNYRMSEMTGAVMRAQLRKLDTLLERHRRNHRFLVERIKQLPEIRFRRSNDPEGEVGWTLDLLLPDKQTRARFIQAIKAENVPFSPPSFATPLPRIPYIANKAVFHPNWPTFLTPRGKEIQYGAACCPRTHEIFERAATMTVGPKYTRQDLEDAVAAVTKVYGRLR